VFQSTTLPHPTSRLTSFACALALLALPACSSEEPAQNNATATATTGGSLSCDIDAAMVSCQGIICHGGPGMAPAITYGAGLDLFGADRVSKLLNQPAKYTAVANPDACPTTPELLINSQNPSASLMATKLQGTQFCGEVMPFGLTIAEADKQCILEWVNLIATDPNAAAAATAASSSSTSTSTSTSASTTTATTSSTSSSTSASSVGTIGAGGMTSTTSTVGTTSSTDGMAAGGSTSVGSTSMGVGGSTGMGGMGMGGGSSTQATGAGGTMAAGGSSGI